MVLLVLDQVHLVRQKVLLQELVHQTAHHLVLVHLLDLQIDHHLVLVHLLVLQTDRLLLVRQMDLLQELLVQVLPSLQDPFP